AAAQLAADGERGEEQAARDRLPVEEHRARAADADPARLADAREPEPVEDADQHLVGAHVDRRRLPVQGQLDPHPIASSTASGVIGRSVTAIPSEASALPIAGGTGGSAVSPSPWICAPSRSSSSWVSRPGMSAIEGMA